MRAARTAWIACLGLTLLVVVAAAQRAKSQHNHAAGHHDYLDWASGKTGNCCNRQDCGTLGDADWREGRDGPEVKIADQWCPVRREHLLIRGKSPDWNVPHACVNKNIHVSPCERLLCFTGKAGS